MSSRKPKQSRLEAASDVLQSVLGNGKFPLSHEFARWRLWSRWDEVVGESIAKHSMPVAYKQGCLYVWVNNSARLQEMTFMVRQIKENINTYVGKKWVNNIRFTLDRKSIPKLEESGGDWRDYLAKSLPNEGGDPPPGQ